MSLSTELQTAIYQRLSNYAALTAVAPVYDDVPQALDSGDNSAFPYVVVGDDNLTPWLQDDGVGTAASITIHTWSRYKGKAETKQIQGILFDALSRHELSLTSYDTITLEWDGEQSFMDADGITRHGVSTFRIILI